MIGATEARIYTPPLRELTPETTLGYMCIEYAKEVLHKTLYPWQEWALIHALEITGSLETGWRFRYRTVLFLISRQNGKTVLSEVIASFFLNVLQVDSIFGTSLSLDKAEEVWEAVIVDQESHPELAAEIDRVSRTNGNKRLILDGNRQYKVGAPTRRAGRGDSNDLVMLDEVREHRDWETWAAAAASINAKPNGIIMCFSNAGDPDSIVLRQLRSQAIAVIEHKQADDFGGSVDDTALGLFEWSAPDGAETDDMVALAQANPALGYGYLTERALLSNRQTFPENKFRSECMCQQVETILPSPFPDGAWSAGLDMQS
jgi:phage terminase large subunit-like protein